MEEALARALQLFVALTGAYLLALWFALIVWTYRDITSRTSNAITQVFSTLIVVLFFVPGAIIYLILRPRETMDDAFQRTMEEEYLLQDLDDFPVCPSCRRAVSDEFLFCPHCRTELRLPCIACHRLLDVRWENCPFCAAKQYEEPALASVGSDDPEQHSSRATRSSKTGPFQSIHGGRSRDSAASPSESSGGFQWEPHDAAPTALSRDDDGQAGDLDGDIVGPRPVTVRGGRDQG